ncbi:protein kinase family protein [Flavobacterium algicola]|uniref:hypothetical protein n=1 Tax=Flavobacterium algicola TaxID=556529 RepID=UPI001EFEB98F|nr:hypothetical protein [Flavobacterium algicola]MCG9791863.1 hypothetical protein [Flavobacterium algicola]
MNDSYITCPECGTVNLNNTYCSNCNALLDVVMKRNLEREKKNQEKIKLEEASAKDPSKIEIFLKKGSEHRNVIIRTFFQASYYVWMFLAFAVGGLISMIIAAAAG